MNQLNCRLNYNFFLYYDKMKTVKTMKCELLGNEVEVVVVRKKNKNAYFRIKEDLKLYITCPIFVKEKEILKMIETNKPSLEKMYLKQKETTNPTDYFKYLGEKYLLVFEENKEGVIINKEEKTIYAKDEAMLEKFVKEECFNIFNEEIASCRQCFRKLPEFTLKVRKMKTRWGVCNRRANTITLNSLLLEKDVDLIDYVIIHEMCHFFEGNHGKKFWDLVSQAYPKYKEARKKLKE